ncbi:MAG TPA: GtrA family protein [Candidatus Saccharimonadales bacterium]|nr:GtrA family protein [Candidatus Saccharimonadales bacterium]
MNKLRNLLQRPLYRYIAVGGSVYVLELVVIVLAQAWGASAVVAVGFAFWIGLVVSFWLQKLVTFGDTRMHHRLVVSQFIAVTLLVLFNFGFTLLATKALSRMLPAVIIRTGALGMTTLWNFYLYNTKIFKTKDEPVTY